MARYAMVDMGSGIVVNVIEWDGDTANWRPPDGYEMVEDVNNEASPGFTYQDGAFTPPPGGQPGAAAATEEDGTG
jgi:hypothetical protein